MCKDLFRMTLGAVFAFALAAFAFAAKPLVPVDPAAAAAAESAANLARPSPSWEALRTALFGTRPIAPATDDVLSLDAPYRAEDAATVPIALQSRLPQTAARHVKTAWLVIDGNPSPLAATFRFLPESGRAAVETRVRIEQYSHVRAIVELNDGSLHMASRYVKASGGCSAPAGKDPAAALANLGKLRLSVAPPPAAGEPRQAQLMVSHPNTTGLAMDQLTRQYPTPHYVRQVTVSYRDKPVFAAEVNFSISENPHFRFFVTTDEGGELKAEVFDTDDRRFESHLALGAGGGA